MAGLGHWYIELEKQGYWRGAAKNWVNRYVMSGSDPSASDAATVIGALKAIEDKLHAGVAPGAGVGFVEGRAYGSGGGYPFETVTYNATGAPATATGFGGATWSGETQAASPTLETCCLIETKLNGLGSRGKPIYLRKYIRGVMYGTSEEYHTAQSIPAPDQAAITTLVAPWTTGMGANNWVVIGPSGKQAASPAVCHPYLVAHQIPRGRKKKAASGGGVLGDLLGDINKLRGVVGDIPDL